MAPQGARSAGRQMAKCPRKWSLCNAPVLVTRRSTSRIAPRSVACTWPSRPSCTSSGCPKARLTFSTLTSALRARAMRNSCRGPWRTMTSSTCGARSPRSLGRTARWWSGAWIPSLARRWRWTPTWWCWPRPPCLAPEPRTWASVCASLLTSTVFSVRLTPNCDRWRASRRAFSWPGRANFPRTFLRPSPRPVERRPRCYSSSPSGRWCKSQPSPTSTKNSAPAAASA